MSDRDLPEAYVRARAADQPFWTEQERSIQGALGQPCCTLSGIASGLITMPGKFAVVVHGEDECASCFRHIGPQTINFFCTGLTEQDFVTGETAEPLRDCLELVATEVDPDAIFVLGACPVEVIGDRFETVVASVARKYGHIPMLALHTSGLKVGTQTAMLDWMFEALASLPTKAPLDRRWRQRARHTAMDMIGWSAAGDRQRVEGIAPTLRAFPDPTPLTRDQCVNFVGLPGRRSRGEFQAEPVAVLEATGAYVVGNYPQGASFEDWQAVKFARNTFVADRSLYPRLVGALEGAGQTVEEIPLPVGFQQSKALYDTVGRVTGRAAAIQELIAPRLAEAEAHVARFRARFGGMRLAYGLRMANNYEADQLAYQGLGEQVAFEELGFDITLLVQGPPDKRERFERMFERRGLKVRFELFTEPWVLHQVLADGKYELAILADHCRNEATKASVPMIPTRDLDPYLGGVGNNVSYLERMLVAATARGGAQ